eukprot:3692502-Amphidinium_carterae.1
MGNKPNTMSAKICMKDLSLFDVLVTCVCGICSVTSGTRFLASGLEWFRGLLWAHVLFHHDNKWDETLT